MLYFALRVHINTLTKFDRHQNTNYIQKDKNLERKNSKTSEGHRGHKTQRSNTAVKGKTITVVTITARVSLHYSTTEIQ